MSITLHDTPPHPTDSQEKRENKRRWEEGSDDLELIVAEAENEEAMEHRMRVRLNSILGQTKRPRLSDASINVSDSTINDGVAASSHPSPAKTVRYSPQGSSWGTGNRLSRFKELPFHENQVLDRPRQRKARSSFGSRSSRGSPRSTRGSYSPMSSIEATPNAVSINLSTHSDIAFDYGRVEEEEDEYFQLAPAPPLLGFKGDSFSQGTISHEGSFNFSMSVHSSPAVGFMSGPDVAPDERHRPSFNWAFEGECSPVYEDGPGDQPSAIDYTYLDAAMMQWADQVTPMAPYSVPLAIESWALDVAHGLPREYTRHSSVPPSEYITEGSAVPRAVSMPL